MILVAAVTAPRSAAATVNTTWTAGASAFVNGGTTVGADPTQELFAIGQTGTAYVYQGYRPIPGAWRLVKQLAAPSGARDFGTGTAVYGSVVAVGATGYSNKAGTVYVFAPNDLNNVEGDWSQLWQLNPSEAGINMLFGYDIAMTCGTTRCFMIVGAPFAHSSKGAAFIFETATADPTAAWTEVARVVDSVASNSLARFGDSVSICSAGVALVGSPRGNTGQFAGGRALAYGRDPSTGAWTENVAFSPPGYRNFYERLGSAVSVVGTSSSGVIAVIGAADWGMVLRDNQLQDETGAAFVYRLSDPTDPSSAWTFLDELVFNPVIEGGRFGSGAVLQGSRIVVTCGTQQATFVFEAENNGNITTADKWVQVARLPSRGPAFRVAITPAASIAVAIGTQTSVFGKSETEDWSDKVVYGAPDDGLGTSVATSAGIVLVGAAGVNGGQGAVQVYETGDTEGSQTLRSTIVAPDGGAFGTAVAVHAPASGAGGVLAVVTATGTNSGFGSAHVFVSNGEVGSGNEFSFTGATTPLLANDGASDASFGTAVACFTDGDSTHVAVVGSFMYGGGVGRAYIFTADTTDPLGTWSFAAELAFTNATGATASYGPWFGKGVAISCDHPTLCLAFVGAPFTTQFGVEYQGSVYLYTAPRDAPGVGMWSYATQLRSPTGVDLGDYPAIGTAVAVKFVADANSLMVVAGSHYGSGPSTPSTPGTVHVWVPNPSGNVADEWTQQVVLEPTDTTSTVEYGFAVDLSDDGKLLAVGAWKLSSGRVYCYLRTSPDGTSWLLVDTQDSVSGSGFGGVNAVAANNPIVIAGATTGNNVVFWRGSGMLVPSGLLPAALVHSGCVSSTSSPSASCSAMVLGPGEHVLTTSNLWSYSTPLHSSMSVHDVPVSFVGAGHGDGRVSVRISSLELHDASFLFHDLDIVGDTSAHPATGEINGGAFRLVRSSEGTDATLTLSVCSVTGGSATRGGCIYSSGGGVVKLQGTEVFGCTASFGGAAYVTAGSTLDLSSSSHIHDTTADVGGCISAAAGHVSATDSRIAGCRALSGGSMFMQEGATATLERSTLFNNTATDLNGGAIVAQGSSVTLQACTLRGNTATRGGAVFGTMRSSVTITNSSFVDNSATGDGGAVALEVSSLTVSASQFVANTAAQSGGALFLTSTSATLSEVDLMYNTANAGDGGCVSLLSSSELDMVQVSAVGNTASGLGGCVSSSASACSMFGGSVTASTAVEGGGVACQGGSVVLDGYAVLNDNVAATRGGGLASHLCSVALRNSSVTRNVVTSSGSEAFTNGGGGASIVASGPGGSTVINITAAAALEDNSSPRGDSDALLLVTDEDCSAADMAVVCAAQSANALMEVVVPLVSPEDGGSLLWLNRPPFFAPLPLQYEDHQPTTPCRVTGMPVRVNTSADTSIPHTIASGVPFPQFAVALFDVYGNVVKPTPGDTVTAVVEDSPSLSLARVSGSTLVAASGVDFRFADLSVFGLPGSSVNLTLGLSGLPYGVSQLVVPVTLSLCPQGTALGADNVTCNPCQLGWVSAGGAVGSACQPCPAGTYRDSEHLECQPCGGADLYCGAGSSEPTRVSEGYFSVGGASATSRTGQEECAPGTYCSSGVQSACGSHAVWCGRGVTTPALAVAGTYTTPADGSADNRTGTSDCEMGTLACLFLLPHFPLSHQVVVVAQATIVLVD